MSAFDDRFEAAAAPLLADVFESTDAIVITINDVESSYKATVHPIGHERRVNRIGLIENVYTQFVMVQNSVLARSNLSPASTVTIDGRIFTILAIGSLVGGQYGLNLEAIQPEELARDGRRRNR